MTANVRTQTAEDTIFAVCPVSHQESERCVREQATQQTYKTTKLEMATTTEHLCNVQQIHYNKLGVCFFIQMISQNWEGLRTSNLAQKWRLVWGWCAHLDFRKVFKNWQNLQKKTLKNRPKRVNFFHSHATRSQKCIGPTIFIIKILVLFVLQHECWITQYLPYRTVHII